MKLYVVDTPTDYHGQSQLVTMAKDKREARKNFENFIGAIGKETVHWDTFRIHNDKVYVNNGCDC